MHSGCRGQCTHQVLPGTGGPASGWPLVEARSAQTSVMKTVRGKGDQAETQGKDRARGGEEMQAGIQASKTTTKAKPKHQRPRDKDRHNESSGPGGSSQPSQSSLPGVGVVSQFIN